MTNKSPVSDEILTAYLDGEIPDKKHDAMTALIAQDEELQQRLGRLQVEFDEVAKAFQQLRVPDLSQQIAVINRTANNRTGNEKTPGLWTPVRLAIAASVVAATFAAGMFVNQLNIDVNNSPSVQVATVKKPATDPIKIPVEKLAKVPAKKPVKKPAELLAGKSAKKPGWRQSVANYMSLYTSETINRVGVSLESQHQNLALLSQDVGLSLTSENLAVGDLDYKRGQILDLRGKPLVQLAYLYQNKTPVAFCIIKSTKGKKTMQFEQRNGMQIAHWSSENHGFMVIGNMPEEELGKLAKSFSVRF